MGVLLKVSSAGAKIVRKFAVKKSTTKKSLPLFAEMITLLKSIPIAMILCKKIDGTI